MNRLWAGGNQERRTVSGAPGCYNSCPRRINVELGSCGPAVKERAESSTDQNRTVGRSSQSANRVHWSTWDRSKTGSCTGRTETKNHVSSCAQTNRCSPARALGQMEGGTTQQVKPTRAAFSTIPFTDISFFR